MIIISLTQLLAELVLVLCEYMYMFVFYQTEVYVAKQCHCRCYCHRLKWYTGGFVLFGVKMLGNDEYSKISENRYMYMYIRDKMRVIAKCF